MTIAGITLFYLAAANAVLALSVGTCTQGSANQLWGGIVSLGLYAIGCLFLPQTNRPALTAAVLLPLAPILIWQAIFTTRLAGGYWLTNTSACDILDSSMGQATDGSEPLSILLWALLTITSGWGFGALITRAYRYRQHNT